MSYTIGVDGGGTKTECVLVDAAGRILARHIGLGCNPSVVGQDTAAAHLRTALDTLRAKAGGPGGAHPVSRTLLCMAGNPEFWRDLARQLEGFGQVETLGDFAPVLELATGGKPGLVLHAGTGSFVAARATDGSTHFAGGLGWRFGDPGSGYDLGRDAIARGLLEIQGWAPPSPLGDAVREQTGLGPDASPSLITRTYYHHHAEANRHIAALAPVVIQLATAGDAVAREIIVKSTGRLLDLAVVVANKLFSASQLRTVPAGLCGPILNHPLVREALAARAPFALTSITETPIEGVRRLLART